MSSSLPPYEPQPSYLRSLMHDYHQQINARADSAVADLQQRWVGVRAALNADIARLQRQMETAKANGDPITYAWLVQSQRLAALKASVEGNIAQFAAGARDIIGQAQLDGTGLGSSAAQELLAATVPPGVAYTFGVPPSDVTDALAGALQAGSPLYNLFEQMGPAAAQQIAQALFTSVALGEGPAAAAARLYWNSNYTMQRAEVIARTELLRSWRGAQMENYRANSDVVNGWQWSADFSDRTCGACIAMDGTIHTLDEDLDDHIMGRCSALPVTRPWSDILAGTGADTSGLTETSIASWDSYLYGNGKAADWFEGLAPEVQNSILGPAKAEAYRAGDLTLEQLAGVRQDPVWGDSIQEVSLKQLGLDAQDYLSAARANGTDSVLADAEALAQAQAGTPAAMAEGFALREPPSAAPLTREELSTKSMAELRQQARDLGLTPARTKSETIDRILAKDAEATLSPAERVGALRTQLDDRMAQRELLYGQQYDALAEQAQLENLAKRAEQRLADAELFAKQDLYRQSLDTSDPEVKRYLKNYAAYSKNKAELAAAQAEQARAHSLMDALSIQGKQGSVEYLQAKAEYEAAAAAEAKARAVEQKLYTNLWSKTPNVYKPELDSAAGFDVKLRQLGVTFTPEQVATNRFMVAAREELAGSSARLAQLQTEIKALDKSITTLNTQIDRDLAQLSGLRVDLRAGAQALTELTDTMRPFSDVITLPEGQQPPNALMNKLDYKMREPRAVTKARIIDDINTRLKNNPAWQEYVARMPAPDRLGVYHGYIDWHADAKDSKSAALVADWIKKWGVGYRPGSPEWVAMQMSVRDEFGLDATIHTAAENTPAGERFYAKNGDAVRALMRAMYDNTQQWFAENGITEIEAYRGFGWAEDATAIPQGINWGTVESPNGGISNIELNPFQSFSADINVSQGTGAGNGFAGGGFGGGSDYSLLIGAKIPVERVLGTAQTGFGAKLESEIVVMGRATDTVAYRAATQVDAALARQADELTVGERTLVYSLGDGGTVRVVANADGTFTITNESVAQIPGGVKKQTIPGTNGQYTYVNRGASMKPGASKTYKTIKGVNQALDNMRIANTYAAPVIESDVAGLGLREDEAIAASAVSGARDAGLDAGLTALIDRIPPEATVADMQDWLQAQIPHLERVNMMALDPQTTRLVANAVSNLVAELPGISGNLWGIMAQDTYTQALAYVPRDGLSLVINAAKWTDLANLAERASEYAAQGWWVTQTPEAIIGHEIGHLFQLNYQIENDTWLAAMDQVAAAGGDPLVSQYASDKIEESFAEAFALLVYGQPTDAQLPIEREMARILEERGIDYTKLRDAVGSPPLPYRLT